MAEDTKGPIRLTLKRTSRVKILGEGRFTALFRERKNGIGDLTISVNGQLTKVHHQVLVKSSDFFKSMLTSGLVDSRAAPVALSESLGDMNVLDIIFDYMYTGNINLSEENISAVVRTAGFFLMTDLKSACSEFLVANVAPSTCISILTLAERYGLKRVKDSCIEVIKAWFPFGMSDSEKAVGMSVECLKVLWEEKIFELMPGNVKATFMQNWCQHFKERCKEGGQLLEEADKLFFLFSVKDFHKLEQMAATGSFTGEETKFMKEFKERKNGSGDLTISVNGEASRAHRAVLVDKSDYFKTMLPGSFKESNAPSIDLSASFPDVNRLNLFLDYMYTGSISLSEENISIVLNAANLFLMSDLLALCSDFILTRITPSTCISTLILADRYNLKSVQAGCFEIMKLWFPLLSDSEEAVAMPPECLKLISDEILFALIPNRVKETFLQKWHAHFIERCDEKAQLSQEVDDLVKSLLANSHDAKASQSATRSAEDKMEDVLVLVGRPPETEPKVDIETGDETDGVLSKHIEIVAFVPAMKTTKGILKHTFGEATGQKTLIDFIGINKKAAFFLFGNGGFTPDCVVSIDFATHKESLIKIPKYVSQLDMTEYFFWEGTLCTFASVNGITWSLLKNNHESLCDEECSGECWIPVCQLPRQKRGSDGDEFLTKVFQDKLYVWMLNDTTKKEMRFFCITQNPNEEGQYDVHKIPSPWKYQSFRTPKAVIYGMSYISVNHEQSLLTFTAKFDSGDGYFENVSEAESSHKEAVFTYDVAKNCWTQAVVGKVKYPKDVPRPLTTSSHIVGLDYFDMPERRRVFDSWQEGCAFWYYAKSTSPYNTHIWKMDLNRQSKMPNGSDSTSTNGTNKPKGERTQWQLLGHIPCQISLFAFWKVDEFPSTHLQGLPRASFRDFSEVLGQSDLSKMSAPMFENDFDVEYEEQLLDGEDYADKWIELWDASN